MSKSRSYIRRLVLDVLKPYDPELHILSNSIIEKVNNIEGVNITVYEMDKLTQKVKVIIEGKNLDFEEISEILDEQNCVIHSVDQIVAGEKLIEDIQLPQDLKI